MTMKRTIIVIHLTVEKKENKKFLHAVRLADGSRYTMLTSKDKWYAPIETAKKKTDEEAAYRALRNAAKAVLAANDVFYDELEIL